MSHASTPIPTLSVVCITRDPGPQVAAVLAPLRSVASEIVVVADDRVGAADLAQYATVADRVIRYPFLLPVERPYAWAHAQCTGDWVLRIDGDEWLSPELIERLPALIARRDRIQYWLPRRWSFPGAAHWIDERPWSPDVQLRLVRNDPATLAFPGIMHSAALPVEPYEIVEEPFYHLDLLLHSEERRTEKTEIYEALRPGLSAPAGGPMEMYYLPEHWAERAPAAAPEAHATGLQAVLVAAQEREGGATAAPPAAPDASAYPLTTREAIDAVWDGTPMAEVDASAVITPLESEVRLEPGETGTIALRVENRGTVRWPGGMERAPLVRLGHEWQSPAGDPLGLPAPRHAFTSGVDGGDGVVVRLLVVAPPQAGDYVVEVDVLEEGVRWFQDAVRIPVSVRPRSAVVVGPAGDDAAPKLEASPDPAASAQVPEPVAAPSRPTPPPPPSPSGELTADEVVWAYESILGRTPGPDEVAGQLGAAPDRGHLLTALVASEEHHARQGAATAGQGALVTASFVDGLRLLNDTLAGAGFADRYWVWGGLLIGYAREGWPLGHDSHDADFCVRRADLPAFEEAARALFAAGFSPLYRFFNNAGQVTEFSFRRGDAKYEFFLLEPAGEGELQYYDLSDGGSGGDVTQAVAKIAEQPLEPIHFIGRTWLKHADHDAELTRMYGDWRTPDPDWWFMDDRAIVERTAWRRADDFGWDGTLGDLTNDGYKR